MEEDFFWKTVKIWSTKQHVVNKRLAGVTVVSSWKLPSSWPSWIDLVEKNAKMKELNQEEAVQDIEWEKAAQWTAEETQRDSSSCLVSLRKCLPKQPRRYQPVFELEFIGVYC